MTQRQDTAKDNSPHRSLVRRFERMVEREGFPAGILLILLALPVMIGCPRGENAPSPPAATQAETPPVPAPASDRTAADLPLPAPAQAPGDTPATEPPPPSPVVDVSPAPAEESLPQSTAELIAEVRAVIEELVQWGPDNLDCMEMKARFLDWLGKSDEAEQIWRQCLEREPRYVHAYVGLASVAAKRGRHAEAIEHARKAVDADPYSFRARDILAEALVNENRPQEAVDALAEFLKLDPRSHGFFLLGRAYTLLEDLPNARKAYEDALRVYPDYAEACYALARVCLRLGDRAASQEYLARYQKLMKRRDPHEQGIEMGRDDFKEMKINAAIIYTDAGRIYLSRGLPRIAERLWRRAAALDPGSVPARELAASLMMDEGRWSEALTLFEELLRVDPSNPRWMVAQAQAYAFAKRPEDAKNTLAEACRRWPDRPEVHAARARFLAALGEDLDEAVQSAQAVVERRPSGLNYALLAWTKFRKGDAAGADEALRKALELDPDNPEIRRVSATIRGDAPSAPSPGGAPSGR
ncbi:tetratricopeptide repeat protein [Thermopirellula anaerolimosa]